MSSNITPIRAEEICAQAAAKFNKEVPSEVSGLVERALAMGISFDISLNVGGGTPTGSDQAASVRNLVDHGGIPLQFESKSGLYSASVNGRKCYVIAVCRGDDKIDEDALKDHFAHLNGGIILDKVDTEQEFGSNLHGLINPLYETLTARDGVEYPVIHLWDERLMKLDPDFGVFSNACHAQWGVYFYPSEQPSIRNNPSCVGQFADLKHFGRGFSRESIVIIGGNPPGVAEAITVLIRKAADERLARYVLERSGMGKACKAAAILYAPKITTASNRVQELSMLGPAQMSRVGQTISDIAKAHAEQGATIIVVPDNTLSMFAIPIRNACTGHNTIYLSMIEVLAQHLKNNRPENLSVLTMPTVANSGQTAYADIYANADQAYAGKIIFLSPSELQNNEKLCLDVKKGDQDIKRLLDRLIVNIKTHALRIQSEDPSVQELSVGLGLTELSLLYLELRKLHDNNLYPLDKRRGCEITENGFRFRKIEKGTDDSEITSDNPPWLMSVKIVDPLTLYASAIAKQAFPGPYDEPQPGKTPSPPGKRQDKQRGAPAANLQ